MHAERRAKFRDDQPADIGDAVFECRRKLRSAFRVQGVGDQDVYRAPGFTLFRNITRESPELVVPAELETRGRYASVR